MGAAEPPVDHVGLGVDVAQEAEAGDDDGIAVFVRLDVDQRDGQHVAPFGALDVDRAGHRVHEVQVDGQHVGGHRVERQVGIERVAGVENDVIARIGPRHRRNRRMVAIEAAGVVGAMRPFLTDLDNGFPGLVGGVGQRRAAAQQTDGERAGQ